MVYLLQGDFTWFGFYFRLCFMFVLVSPARGEITAAQADFDGSGTVDFADFLQFVNGVRKKPPGGMDTTKSLILMALAWLTLRTFYNSSTCSVKPFRLKLKGIGRRWVRCTMPLAGIIGQKRQIGCLINRSGNGMAFLPMKKGVWLVLF